MELVLRIKIFDKKLNEEEFNYIEDSIISYVYNWLFFGLDLNGFIIDSKVVKKVRRFYND